MEEDIEVQRGVKGRTWFLPHPPHPLHVHTPNRFFQSRPHLPYLKP